MRGQWRFLAKPVDLSVSTRTRRCDVEGQERRVLEGRRRQLKCVILSLHPIAIPAVRNWLIWMYEDCPFHLGCSVRRLLVPLLGRDYLVRMLVMRLRE